MKKVLRTSLRGGGLVRRSGNLNRLSAIILTAVMLFSMIPLTALTATAAETEVAETGADPTFYGVAIPTDGAGLKTLLEADGDIMISLNKDISARIGEKGDRNAEYVEYWCTLGKGTKVLRLNGYDIDLYYDRKAIRVYNYYTSFKVDKETSMFNVPAGSELVINDSKNSGTIHFDGMLKDDAFHLDQRNLITVNGGKLTVNNGILEAGRSQKVHGRYSDGGAWTKEKDFYRQINGTAIVLKSGQATINGGELYGRGYRAPEGNLNSLEDEDLIRCAAVRATGGSLTVYDGEFWGKGCADVMQIGDSADIRVYGGEFDTHRQDLNLDFEDDSVDLPRGVDWYMSTSYGNIGIPGRALSLAVAQSKTEVYKKGSGKLTYEQVYANETLETSKYIAVKPEKKQSFRAVSQFLPNENRYGELPIGTVYEWDKSSPLRFVVYNSLYYPSQRDYDQVNQHEHGVKAGLRLSYDGENYVHSVAVNENGEIDLNDMPQVNKDKLQVGQTFYLRFYDMEVWSNGTGEHVVNHEDGMLTKVKIVEPDMTAPELDIAFDWSNPLDNSLLSMGMLSPAGDCTKANLDKLIRSGRINSYVATFSFYNNKGTWTSQSFNDTVNKITRADMYRGITRARYMVDLYKNGEKLSHLQSDGDIVCFPNITASVTPDSSRRALIDASAANKKITLSCTNANSTTGIFWAKDGAKIASSVGSATYTADLSSSGAIGWYSVGYTMGGKDYISDEMIYLGIKAGTRTLGITGSAATCSIKQDGSTTPTLTAKSSGTGWGTITRYKWQNVSWPADTKPNVKYKTTTGNTITIAELFGAPGHETQFFTAGTYKFSVTAYDNYDNSATSGTVTINVSRPPQGIEIHANVDGYNMDVSNGFVVTAPFNTVDFDYLLTPQNSAGSASNISYSSSDTSVAEPEGGGSVYARKPGSANVTVKYGSSISASAKLLVSTTKYDLTIDEKLLTPKAGETVYRGALSVPSSANFTAELIWNYVGQYSSSSREFTGDTFEGNLVYYPTVRIYPKNGVVYPVDIKKPNGASGRTDYTVDPDRFEITINGMTYYGATYCGKDTFFDAEPVSSGDKSYDFIDLDMERSEKLIDWRDDYLDRVMFNLDIPNAGSKKQKIDDISWMPLSSEQEGVLFLGNSVMHVTDISSIKDDDPANDKTEDFSTYQAGEIYRYSIHINKQFSYRNAHGGQLYFTESTQAMEPEHRTLTDSKSADSGYITAFVYFTPSDITSGDVSGSVTSFLTGAEKVTLELIPEGESEAKYSTEVYGNSTTYTLGGVPEGKYTLRVSKKNHVTRDYEITVSGGPVTQDVKIHPLGDINGDGKVTTVDYGRTNSHARGKTTLTGYEFRCADVTKDNKVTTADAGKINSHARGKSTLWS